MADYVSSLKSRILDCQFGCGCQCECRCDDKINDIVLRAQFIRGLADNHTREQLLKIKDITIQDAVDEAVVLETSREQNTEFVKSKAVLTEAVHRVSRCDLPNKSSDLSNSNMRGRNCSQSRNFHNKNEKVQQSNRSYSKNRISFREFGTENLCVRCGRDNHLQN